MSDRLTVLGINAAHDASACLLVDGRLVTAVAEERLSRIKHHAGFPRLAVEYCLRSGQLDSLSDVDCIVLNQPPSRDFDLELRCGGYAGELITNPSHHLMHAYYAWVASGFETAAIIVADGSGYSYGEHLRRGSPLLGDAPPYSEMEEAESLYVVRHGGIELIGKRWALWEAGNPYCRFASLGHMFSMASQYIFGSWKYAGKVMGLAAYGDASAFPEPFVDLSGPEMTIRTDWPCHLPPRSACPAHLDPVCRNVAAKVQAELERAMLYLATRVQRQTGETHLCISGGVALNGAANRLVRRQLQCSELFVTPAAGDSGISLGAALYGHHRRSRTLPRWEYVNDYHGRGYSPAEVVAALSDRHTMLNGEPLDDRAAVRAARDLAGGAIIGWFEGRSELGPRALGHRSILCDPRSTDSRDRLNALVKLREPFRPFGVAVLAEHAQEYFDVDWDDPFMLTIAPIRPRYQGEIAGVCHHDGTCRIQTVNARHPGRFRALIECFTDLTGIPMVLNTSFNVRGEPIVETPGDAMDCFLASNIDVLYIDGWRVTKATLAAATRPHDLVPVLIDGLSFGATISSVAGRASQPRHQVQTRTGFRADLSADDFGLLCGIDGSRTVRELEHTLGADVASLAAFGRLQQRGFICFACQRLETTP